MLAKLENLEKRFEEVNAQLATPEVVVNPKLLRDLSKEHRELQEVVAKFREYKKVMTSLADDQKILRESNDRELREMATLELEELQPQQVKLEDELKLLLVPRDPHDDRNVISLRFRITRGARAPHLYRRYYQSTNV